MLLLDVNVLVYAFRPDAQRHKEYQQWVENLVNGDSAYACTNVVLSGFLRLLTHPRIFDKPSSLVEALDFAATFKDQPHCVQVHPGPRHWEIFSQFCREVNAKGNLVPDAYLAAIAVESGCEWVTTDRDFSRFPGLRWRHPLDN